MQDSAIWRCRFCGTARHVMSDLKFVCIHCGQKLSCDPALVGHRISCPVCGRSLVVPWGSASAAVTIDTNMEAASSLAGKQPRELPKIHIPPLSLPDVAGEASSSPALPKVARLEESRRPEPGICRLAAI